MVSSSSINVSVGLYTPAEAAYYARLRTATMTRWIHGNRVGKAVVHAQLPNDPERTVTFLDFVQALAIREIRREHKVPLSVIRDAVQHVRRKYEIKFPFAMNHKTYLFGNEILIDIDGRGLMQISGKNKNQGVIQEVAELYMKDLSFSTAGLAYAYRAFEYRGREIVMKPSLHFGQPLVKSCGYSALALLHGYHTEGSVRACAKAFGVKGLEVELAIRYDDYLRGVSVA